MPYNILLLPLLAGYLFLSRSRFKAYATARLPKDQLLLAAAGWGFLFLILSRAFCYALLQTSWGLALGNWLHKVAPFEFIGTAIGTLLLAEALIRLSNMFVSERIAGLWLYHRADLDPLMRVLWSSNVGVEPFKPPGAFLLSLTILRAMLAFLWKVVGLKKLLRSPREIPEIISLLRSNDISFSKLRRGDLKTVMINLKDGKVLVGYVADLLTTNPSVEFVTIAPLWSGYRDSSSRVFKTVDYSATIEAAIAEEGESSTLKDPKDFSRVIRIADISSAAVFNPGAFEIRESEAHVAKVEAVPAPAPVSFWERLVLAFKGYQG